MDRANRNKAFLDLQAKWDQKLSASGFRDIEDRKSGMLVKDPQGAQPVATASYYALADILLFSGPFDSKEDRRIWRLHAKGLSYLRISKETGIHLETVRRRIYKYRGKMLGSGK